MRFTTRRTLGLAAAIVLGGVGAIFASPGTASAMYCEYDRCGQASAGFPECQPAWWQSSNCTMYFDARGNRYCSTSPCIES